MNQDESCNLHGRMIQPNSLYNKQVDFKPFCAFCGNQAHHLSQCIMYQQFDVEAKRKMDHGERVETFAILDDGSERTMLQMLVLNGAAESLKLRTT